MNPASAVVQRLLSLAAVTAIVGYRIYRVRLPQSPTYPAVRVTEVSAVPEGGQLRGQGGAHRARIQVDAYVADTSGGDTATAMDQLTEAISGPGDGTALDGWMGTVGTLRITAISKADRSVTYAPDDLRVLIGRQDFFVWTYTAS